MRLSETCVDHPRSSYFERAEWGHFLVIHFSLFTIETMVNTVIVLLSFTSIIAHAAVISDSYWLVWKTYHGKSYEDDNEEHMRYIIWKENLKYIINHAHENHSYVLAMNQFGDLVSARSVPYIL